MDFFQNDFIEKNFESVPNAHQIIIQNAIEMLQVTKTGPSELMSTAQRNKTRMTTSANLKYDTDSLMNKIRETVMVNIGKIT